MNTKGEWRASIVESTTLFVGGQLLVQKFRPYPSLPLPSSADQDADGAA
jgi:hypothetical protein